MLNFALLSMLVLGNNEELPVANFDNNSSVVIVKRSTPLRRRVFVELPVATVTSGVNIVRKTSDIVVTKVDNIREIISEKPIFPRVNSIIKNITTPIKVNNSTIIIEENPNQTKIEKKTTVSSKSNNDFVETTETNTTFQSDMIFEQRRGLLGRTRFRFFR